MDRMLLMLKQITRLIEEHHTRRASRWPSARRVASACGHFQQGAALMNAAQVVPVRQLKM